MNHVRAKGIVVIALATISDPENFRLVAFRTMRNELTTALLNILPDWSKIDAYNSQSFSVLFTLNYG